MIVDRYYYNQLNKQEKSIYRVLYKGLQDHKDLIPIKSKCHISQEMIYRIFSAITDDNPLMYYVNQSVLDIARDQNGNVALCPKYFFPEDKIKEYNKKIQDVVNRLALNLKLTEGSELEKEIRVHDFFCRHITYDHEGANLENLVSVISSHNIIGVFAYHTAQCEGIAKAVKVLLNAVDIKCIVVSGNTTEDGMTKNHAWNIVKINGLPYHVDITWDIGASKDSMISYDYFNVTDEQIRSSHVADGNIPACISEKANYFRQNHLIFSNKLLLKAYVEKELKAGKDELYFKVTGNLKPQSVIKEITEYGTRFLVDSGKKVLCEQRVNAEMKTCKIIYH